jgi:hypothetical protein
VAVRAMHCTVQELVLTRQRARRNLGMRTRCETSGHEKKQAKERTP